MLYSLFQNRKIFSQCYTHSLYRKGYAGLALVGLFILGYMIFSLHFFHLFSYFSRQNQMGEKFPIRFIFEEKMLEKCRGKLHESQNGPPYRPIYIYIGLLHQSIKAVTVVMEEERKGKKLERSFSKTVKKSGNSFFF